MIAPPLDLQIRRYIAGETVLGMRVAAWTWDVPTGLPKPSSQTLPRYATHWSTGPEHAERLFRESEVVSLIDSFREHTERLAIALRQIEALTYFSPGNTWEEGNEEDAFRVGELCGQMTASEIARIALAGEQ